MHTQAHFRRMTVRSVALTLFAAALSLPLGAGEQGVGTGRSGPEPPRFGYRSVLFLDGGRPGSPYPDLVTHVVAAPDGGVFLLSASGEQLVRLSPDGKVVLDLFGSALGGGPRAVAPLPDGGFVLWGERQPDGLQQFDAHGHRGAFLRLPLSQTPIRWVSDLQLGPDGILYGLDYLTARVHRLRPGGGALPPLSLPEAKRSSLWRLAVSQDSLYLGGEGPELLRYRLDGIFAGRVPLPHHAEDIACDGEGNLLVLVRRSTPDTSSAPRVLYRIRPDGRLLGAWHPVRGLAPGELAGTTRMSVGPGNVLFTLEQHGPEGDVPNYPARLQKWLPVAPTPSPLHVIRDETPREAAPVVLRRVLSTRLGTRLGRLTAPVADSAGRVYVGETLVDPSTQHGRTRVLRFTARGRGVEALGYGTFRDRDGFPASIAAVAIHARTGEIYAASDTEHLIRVFGPEGRVRRTIPLPDGFRNQTYTSKPLSLTVGPTGSLLFPDDDRSRLWVFEPAARAWRSFGHWGQGPAGFHMPVGVSAGGREAVYVADTKNRRVLRFDSRLRYRFEIRYQDAVPWNVAAASDGGCVVVYETAIARYDHRGQLLWRWQAPGPQSSIGSGGAPGGGTLDGGVTIAPDGTVYFTARICYDDSHPPAFLLTVLGKQSWREAAAPRLRVVAERSWEGVEASTVAVTPLGLCIGSATVQMDGTVVRRYAPRQVEGKGKPARIADANWTAGRLVLLEAPPDGTQGFMAFAVYDRDGRRAAAHPLPIHFGSPGWSLGGISAESTLPQIAARGHSLFVSSPNRGKVVECDLSGKVRRNIGTSVLTRPVGVAVGPEGALYVADAARHRVDVFDQRGNHVRSLGGPGQAEFLYPSSLAFGPDGSLYVLDQGAGEVLRVTRRGALISRSDTIGGAELTRVAVDGDGTVYLAGDRLRVLRAR